MDIEALSSLMYGFNLCPVCATLVLVHEIVWVSNVGVYDAFKGFPPMFEEESFTFCFISALSGCGVRTVFEDRLCNLSSFSVFALSPSEGRFSSPLLPLSWGGLCPGSREPL